MRTLKKSLLAASVVLSLSPAAAFAAKPQCEDICYESPCSTICDVRGRTTTCAENAMYWGCIPSVTDIDPAATEAQQAEASRVCSEQDPAAEQSATVES
ncbi:hypothetical protein JYK02_04775 [Corallococcus macrosporus]|uniref:Uncharacterized protein n=1 Tax=Corallococcus macrosporus TaxID=35 RepID=A0ABS3D577_9BACT|nr:hypothetical protein [Corallococcus macrosporus]MBN8226820.1 hypothetical protein [Corallococcus macrosporus]